MPYVIEFQNDTFIKIASIYFVKLTFMSSNSTVICYVQELIVGSHIFIPLTNNNVCFASILFYRHRVEQLK